MNFNYSAQPILATGSSYMDRKFLLRGPSDIADESQKFSAKSIRSLAGQNRIFNSAETDSSWNYYDDLASVDRLGEKCTLCSFKSKISLTDFILLC